MINFLLKLKVIR